MKRQSRKVRRVNVQKDIGKLADDLASNDPIVSRTAVRTIEIVLPNISRKSVRSLCKQLLKALSNKPISLGQVSWAKRICKQYLV